MVSRVRQLILVWTKKIHFAMLCLFSATELILFTPVPFPPTDPADHPAYL